MSRWQAAGGVILFTAGVAVGHFFLPSGFFPGLHDPTDTNETDSATEYKFVNPLLFCKDQDASNYTNAVTADMENKLRDYLSAQESAGALAEASVYYKDLNEGPWVLIHNSMKTVPASLLKVPTAIAVYKAAEEDPSLLSKTFSQTATNTPDSLQYFKPPKAIVPGKKYTTEDLVAYMLQDSDNAALFLLGGSISNSQFAEAYSDLGVPVPTELAPKYTVDVKTFASFFRVLYNASYLNAQDSEHVLSLLSDSDFPQGIHSGVPAGTVVADKFGEYPVSESDLRLNDCGIVYRPHDPYILCILARGESYDALAKVIAGISSLVWGVLDAQR